MTAMTLTPVRTTTRPIGLALGSVAGAALFVAGVWNALLQEHVTTSAPPSPQAGATPEESMHAYYTWYAGIVGQQRAVTIVAMVGVTGLLLVADALRRRTTDIVGRAACTAIVAGGLVWLVGSVIAIGGHRAVGLMATHGNPLEGVNSIAFTVDMTVDAFSTAALVLLGLAMVAIGIAPVRPLRPRWALLSIGAGLVSFVVAFGYVNGVDAITSYVLGALAALLLPAWMVWTGRLLDQEA
jgi:hypothetical protein